MYYRKIDKVTGQDEGEASEIEADPGPARHHRRTQGDRRREADVRIIPGVMKLYARFSAAGLFDWAPQIRLDLGSMIQAKFYGLGFTSLSPHWDDGAQIGFPILIPYQAIYFAAPMRWEGASCGGILADLKQSPQIGKLSCFGLILIDCMS